MSDEARTGLTILCVLQAIPFVFGLTVGAWIGRGEPARMARGIASWLRMRFER